jgi:hypothetical protein
MSGKFILPNKGIGSAESVSLNTSTFNGVLSSADDTVQKALQTIDDAGGLDGSDGATGIKGETGIQGAQGETGIQGTTGAQGIKGDQGDAFQVDFFGSFDEAVVSSVESGSYTPSDPYMQVVTTDDRSNTTSPINGDLEGHAVSYDGTAWYDFGQFTGLKGERGETGIAGLAGIQGETGLQGVAGAQGETGIQGIAGAQGTTGVAGIQGATGIMGIMGIKGDQGDTGIQGVTGPQGVDSGPKNLQQVLDTGDSADRSASLAGSFYGGHIALKKEFRNGNDGEQWVDHFSRHMFKQDGQRKNILGGNMVSQTQTDLDLYPAGISLTPASGLINIPPWFYGYTTRLLTKIETSWVGFVGDNQYLRQTIHDQNRGISAERFKSSTGTWSSWEPLTSNQLIVSNGNEGPESDVWQNGVYYSSVTSGSSGYPAGFGLLMGIREGNSRHVQYFYERYSSNTYVRYQSNAENTWSSWTLTNIPGAQGETGIQGPKYDISEWSPSTPVTLGHEVFYRGSIFTSLEARTTGLSFADEIDKWQLVGSDLLVVNQTSHGLSQLDPVYISGSSWLVANANGSNTLATHIVLDASADWLILSDKGTYDFPSHGKATGIHYCSTDGTGLTTAEPVSGYINPCLDVIDANTISILSYLPAMNATASVVNTGEKLLHKILVQDGVALNNTVNIDTQTYPFIKIRANLTSTGPTTTGAGYLWMAPNSNTAANSYGEAVHSGGRNSAGTNVGYETWTWRDRVIVGNYGGTSLKMSSLCDFDTRNDGSSRVMQLLLFQSSNSSYSQAMHKAAVWFNTSDDITSILFDTTNTTRYGYIWVYGRSD